MKYIAFVPLFFLAACNAKISEKSWICVNPFMALSGIYVGPDAPEVGVKERKDFLELTDANGNTVIMPKTLCAEVRKAKQ